MMKFKHISSLVESPPWTKKNDEMHQAMKNEWNLKKIFKIRIIIIHDCVKLYSHSLTLLGSFPYSLIYIKWLVDCNTQGHWFLTIILMTFIDRLKPGSSTLFKHAIKKQQLKRIHLDVFSPSVHNDVKQRHLKTELFENGAFCLRVSKTGFWQRIIVDSGNGRKRRHLKNDIAHHSILAIADNDVGVLFVIRISSLMCSKEAENRPKRWKTK